METITETNTPSDALGFFEHLALHKREGVKLRVSAEMQRKHFGWKPFGKCQIIVKGNVVKLFRTIAYGMDFEIIEIFLDQCDGVFRYCHNDKVFPLA